MSKYRIMLLLSKKDDLGNLYKYDTTEIDGQVLYREFDTVEEVDAYVETLLNDQNYSKDEILVVREREFTVNVEYDDANTGEPGTTPGKDGFSPIAKVTQTETGATISITDKSGTTTATVNNGKDGIDGTDGTNGADGFSPSIAESAGNNDTVYKLDITNKIGKITTPNLKGVDGADGVPGEKGDKGDTGTSIRLKGAWTPSTEYVNNSQYIDVITYDGNTYGCKTSHTSGDSWDVTNWVLLASKGSKGDTGEKGETGANGTDGQDGDPGASAGFGTPTATVDNNVGVPSVVVTATGEDTAKVFNFEFKNLKGEKGEKGDKGDTGATGTNGTDGKSITAITLTKDSTGAITVGTATLSDQSQVPITITIEETT